MTLFRSPVLRLAACLWIGASFGFGAPSAHAAEPERIVSLGGAITEILYALKLEDRIVGVDTTSLFPPEALKDKPNVGYLRTLSAEGILSLKPSLILAVEGAGPPDVLNLLKETKIDLVRLPEDSSPAGVVRRIESIGALAGAKDAANELAARVSARFKLLEQARAGISKPVRVLFVLSLQNDRPLVGGHGSTADAIIALAGGVNVADAIEGYKPITDEAILAGAPDLVLMMDSGNHAVSSETLFALPAFSATPAAVARALVRMDGNYLLGFGPRSPDAARDLMKALYPSLAIPDFDSAAAR